MSDVPPGTSTGWTQPESPFSTGIAAYPHALLTTAFPETAEDAHTRRMSKTDACPECLWNVELPRSAAPTADGFRADYLCSDCGHSWFTSWRTE